MKRVIIGNLRILKNSWMFKRYIFIFMAVALGNVGVVWVLKNMLPDVIQRAIEATSKDGSINLGFVKFESIDAISHMNITSLLEMAFSSPFLVLICAIFAIECISRLNNNGFWEYLLIKNVKKTKMYLGTMLSTFLASEILVLVYLLTTLIAGAVALGFESLGGAEVLNFVKFILLQVIVMLGVVSFFTLIIHLARNTTSSIISAVVLAMGMSEVTSIIAGITGIELVRFLWIGADLGYLLSANAGQTVLILIVSLICAVLSNLLGMAYFKVVDLK